MSLLAGNDCVDLFFASVSRVGDRSARRTKRPHLCAQLSMSFRASDIRERFPIQAIAGEGLLL